MTHDLVKLRHYWQWLMVIAVAMAAWWQLPATFCAVDLGILKLVCPVAFLECCLSSKTVAAQLLPGFLVISGLVVLLGRAFCAWTCPARMAGKAADYFVSQALRGPTEKVRGALVRFRERLHDSTKPTWSDGLALTAGLFAGIALFSFPAYSIFCPAGVLSRNLVELATHFRLRWDLIFLGIPLAAGLFFALGWKCACPVGLMQGLLAKGNRTLQPVVELENCAMCGRCARNCDFGVSLHKGDYDSFACSKCMKCVRDCERQAVRLKFWTRSHQENRL